MKNLSLQGKLISSFLLAGLIPLIAIGFYSYQKSSESLQKEAVDKLVAVRNIKGDAVKRYFDTIKSQVLTFSQTVSIKEAMRDFSISYKNFLSETEISEADLILYKASLKNFYLNEFGAKYKKENGTGIDSVAFLDQLSDTELALQYHYISANSNPLGSKETLDAAADKSTYTKLHAIHHPSIRSFLEEFGYYDIFLVDIKTGHIVYSVFKELDYATSLLIGPYSNTNFAEAFKRAREISDPKDFILVDYKKYPPSYEAPASFIASPIWENGKKIGIAIFQMPIDRLNAIMGERSGMGKTGETYLFGQDRLMRSDSFLNKENYNVVSSFKNPSKGSLDSSSVAEALKGQSGERVGTNYLGQEVITAFTPINILGLKWGLAADISTSEAFSPANAIKNILLIMTITSCILIVVFAFFLSSSLSRKIQLIANKLLENAKEVGLTSEDISNSSIKLSEASTEAASSLQETVASIDEISSMVQKNADAANNSTQVSSKSNDAANRGKKTVESMISSINDISKSSDEIANEMQRNNAEISKIVQVISEIGDKTKVINDIVFQTKLLSFNASVEAARAGEHGKGFAVVAEEVGNLAAMSGKAALEITEMLDGSVKQVTNIVDSTKKNVEVLINNSKERVKRGTDTASDCDNDLNEILQNVTSVNELVREIAAASSEQATGVREVTSAMQQLDSMTHQNTSVAQESSSMASKLKEQATGLNGVVDELIGLINGRAPNNSRTNVIKGPSGQDHANIVSITRDKETTIHPGNKEVLKMASGDSISTQGDTDPQFEDL